MTPDEQHLVEEFDAAIDRAERRLQSRQRYFIDSLTLTGELKLIPADRRAAWDEFDCLCEDTHEELAVPTWA